MTSSRLHCFTHVCLEVDGETGLANAGGKGLRLELAIGPDGFGFHNQHLGGIVAHQITQTIRTSDALRSCTGEEEADQ